MNLLKSILCVGITISIGIFPNKGFLTPHPVKMLFSVREMQQIHQLNLKYEDGPRTLEAMKTLIKIKNKIGRTIQIRNMYKKLQKIGIGTNELEKAAKYVINKDKDRDENMVKHLITLKQ